ncbi:MFS transporter, partial [Chloroflexota bacterium]
CYSIGVYGKHSHLRNFVMIKVGEDMAGIISKGIAFLGRQKRDWKITVARTSLFRFVYQMVIPYQSIYTIALGASATQLGIVNSAGMGIAGILSPLNGWLIDRIGIKMIFLVGIGFLIISYLTYGLAQSWPIIIFAMAVFYLGDTTSIHSCATVCANSLASEDRATGMAFCETLAAGLLGIVGPLLGAFLVTTFGGVNVSGIRPLFFISFLVTIGTFFLILTQLSSRRWGSLGTDSSGFLGDLAQVFQQGHNLKRWLVISTLSGIPMGMVLPFSQVFAHEVKGAEEYVLGAMVTGMAMTSLLLGIPIGRLADKIGRKRVLYLTSFLVWISSLLLIWAPRPEFLIASSFLLGFFHIGGPVSGAMGFELVPPEHMGRWLGIIRFFRLIFAAGTAYLAGVIWDNIGPQYVFLTAIALDLFIRIPLLIGMPETLASLDRTKKLE